MEFSENTPSSKRVLAEYARKVRKNETNEDGSKLTRQQAMAQAKKDDARRMALYRGLGAASRSSKEA
jgi:hypothetical protein